MSDADLRFALKAHEPIAIAGDIWRQDLHRDFAFQPGVAGAIDVTHSAFAKLGRT